VEEEFRVEGRKKKMIWKRLKGGKKIYYTGVRLELEINTEERSVKLRGGSAKEMRTETE